MKKDFYRILEVSLISSEEEIKDAYRRLAREHHPDVSKNEDSAVIFAEISEAYATLGDAEKRRIYDEERSKALVVNLEDSATSVVDEYFAQFEAFKN